LPDGDAERRGDPDEGPEFRVRLAELDAGKVGRRELRPDGELRDGEAAGLSDLAHM